MLWYVGVPANKQKFKLKAYKVSVRNKTDSMYLISNYINKNSRIYYHFTVQLDILIWEVIVY